MTLQPLGPADGSGLAGLSRCPIAPGEAARELRRAKRIIQPDVGYAELARLTVFEAPALWRPRWRRIPTHLTGVERCVLFLLARTLGPRAAAVEIGSFLGASACCLAAGLRRSARLYCVDTWNNDAMGEEAERDTFLDFHCNVADFAETIQPLRGRSDAVAASFDGAIDLLFIDGDHAYQGCLTDWRCWKPHLQPGAILVFHDCGWAEGVQQVIAEEVAPLVRDERRMANMYVAWL